MRNEKGSTLILVLIVILVFSVIGLSIMAQVINENRLTVHSEKEMQARYLAESGLVYFEQDILNYLGKDEFNLIDYRKEDIFNEEDEGEQANIIKVERIDDTRIEVFSEGIVDDAETTLVGTYELTYEIDIEKKTYDLADFTKSGTAAIDFADTQLLGIGLLNLLNADVLKVKGNDNRFYTVPKDQSILNVNVLGLDLLELSGGDSFNRMEERPVIAVREGGLAKIGALGGDNPMINLSVLSFGSSDVTNVLLNGFYEYKILLIIPAYDHKHIDFQKFAVIGNMIIQQNKKTGLFSVVDNQSRRYFSFREGLYVYHALIIGGKQNNQISNLGLIGDMVAIDKVDLTDVNLLVGERNNSKYIASEYGKALNIYSHGDVEIKNSCIKLKDSDYDFRIFAKGEITIVNDGGCDNTRSYPGFYYAENGITIHTNNRNMKIDGAVAGDLNIIGSGKVNITGNHDLAPVEEIYNYKLNSVGRRFK